MNSLKTYSILSNMQRLVSLTKEEEKAVQSIVSSKKLKKRQFIEQPNFVCKHQTYVKKGALRSYFISDDGVEHTIQFAIEDWFISDFNSYLNQTPATLFVEAIEDSEIEQISFSETEQLCHDFPVFERYFRLVAQKAFAYSQQRILSKLNDSAEKRYILFNEIYPQIVKRVPQYMLASYLGMSPEFLSKVRKKITTSA